ncbi:tetratricopeptide repeat protein [Amphritea pacifica]|uniref:tetratricopeptide repeat protein n=1 Tax=Amphritea pacifica TaxID=2811233 RepID=UPI0019660D0A|nr:tetratricopeptide repeat protein [Amphritea pacifica]MBN1007075.1 sel1 repeat family protein [Amphritea pacifica]
MYFRILVFILFIISASAHAVEDSDFTAGYAAYEKENYEAALVYFVKSAESGNVSAQNNLGWMYLHGLGTDIDYDMSFYWYQKASVSNEPLVLYMLGQAYLYGHGTTKSKETAFKFYHQAHGQGIPEADLRVGMDYYFGIVSKQNLEKGRMLILQSAEANQPYAQCFMGILALENNDRDKALSWFRRAEAQDYQFASALISALELEEDSYLEATKKILSGASAFTSLEITVTESE